MAGGGVGALEAVMALRDLAGDRVRLTLLAPDDDFVYTPLSVGEPFGLSRAERVPLARVADDFHAELVHDRLAAVDTRHASAVLGDGSRLRYEKLIVATGAPRVPVHEHAATFRGHDDVDVIRELLAAIESGSARRMALVVPSGVAWSLPVYELALLIAAHSRSAGAEVEITVVTPEDRPLGIFGGGPSADVAALLEQAGVRVLGSAAPEVPRPGVVVPRPGADAIEVDRVVALPVTSGPNVSGLPADRLGFIPIDSFARVSGVHDVYAVGDATNFPLKQGGIACQQADAAAAHIARWAGARLQPEPFRPVLRGRLMTGGAPQFMRRDVSARGRGREESAQHVLWWPGAKVAGRYFASYIEGDGHGRADVIAPGVRRRAYLASAEDTGIELPLRGYEFEGRWTNPPAAAAG